ncbi:side tail fiber protein [Salmonella enterica subsp. enterica]|uniref:Side tail fiber protein n=1 Tax=Salmonella enterica I TaxID=59201 RepID=A0A379UKW7_SALET|nr:side tail fiber protein [Salmonella enterica subsp. enterica]
MPVLISGVLKDGTGTPVQNCTIQLKGLPDQYDGGREYGGIRKSG